MDEKAKMRAALVIPALSMALADDMEPVILPPSERRDPNLG